MQTTAFCGAPRTSLHYLFCLPWFLLLDFLACAAGATERAGATQGGARHTGVWAEPRGEGARGGENKNEIRAAAPPRGGRRGTEAV